MNAIRDKWDNIYQQKTGAGQEADVLSEHLFLLPQQGHALDLASGLGASALLLAREGLQVEAWDISSVALEKLDQQAAGKQLNVTPRACDITPATLQNHSFDVIVISRFLDRSLSHAIIAALNPGGLLFYQTFVQDKVSESGPCNPDFLLKNNELLHMFSPLQTVFYREYSRIGDLSVGERNEAMYIGRKA